MFGFLGVLLIVGSMLLAGLIALANGMSDAPGADGVSYLPAIIIGALGIACLFL